MKPNLPRNWLKIVLVAEATLLVPILVFHPGTHPFGALTWISVASIFLFKAPPTRELSRRWMRFLAPLSIAILWIYSMAFPIRWYAYNFIRCLKRQPEMFAAYSKAKATPGRSGKVDNCEFSRTDALRMYCAETYSSYDSYGFVFDPTDQILKINAPKATKDHDLKRLFDREFMSVTPLGNHWFVAVNLSLEE